MKYSKRNNICTQSSCIYRLPPITFKSNEIEFARKMPSSERRDEFSGIVITAMYCIVHLDLDSELNEWIV